VAEGQRMSKRRTSTENSPMSEGKKEKMEGTRLANIQPGCKGQKKKSKGK